MKRINRYRDLEAEGFGSRTTVWRKWKSDKFPPPDYFDDGHPIWLDTTIENHVEAKVAEARTAA